jgi:hypothetical protein
MAEKKAVPVVPLLVGILTIFALVGISASVYLYRQWNSTKKLLNNPTEATKVEVKDLVSRISKLMILPNEEPQLATVWEQEKLKDQQFFSNAKNGDKILIFVKAQKAVLFRPTNNIIVEVAPLVPQNDATGSAQLNTTPYRIALRNGTDTTGLTKKVEDDLHAKVQNITFVEKDNAKEKTYKETYVYDVSGAKAELVKQLATLLNAKVGTSLPIGESKPDADFLIIIGADKK